MQENKENQEKEPTFEFKTVGSNQWGVDFVEDGRTNTSTIVPEETRQVIDIQPPTPVQDNYEDEEYEDEEYEDDEGYKEDEKVVDNFAYYTAKKLKDEGILPVDEIDETVTFDDIYNAYRYTAEERVKNEVLSEVQRSLEAAGLKDDNIVLLQAIENGVPIDELNVVSRLQKYSTVDVNDVDDNSKLSIIKEMYSLRDMTDREIERNISAIQSNDEVDDEFRTAQDFFKGAVDLFNQEQSEISRHRLEAEKSYQQRNLEILSKAIKYGDIAGERITSEQSREIERDIFERKPFATEDGRQFMLSPFEEYIWRLNNDFEFQLLNFKNFKFRGKEVEIMKQRAMEEADKDYWSAFKKAQSKSIQKGSIKKEQNKGKDFYINESGGRTYEF
jgi:hypothetical protein